MLPSALTTAVIATGETASTGVLDDSMIKVITDGFASMSGSVGQVLTVAVPATVGIIALVAGTKFAIKMIRGALKNAG